MHNFIKDRASSILKEAYGTEAYFREGQLDAIASVVEKKKTLVVQKTGWGKSVVYFIATKILRENGAGPAIIVSPLLALMKNQVDAAVKLGIRAVTINTDNKVDWDAIYSDLGNYDAIIISPERLSNDKFMERLAELKNIQLFVVDEAHSISDWGHDFRPDYQRIVNLLDNFPADVAILGTTATANNRVIDDIKNQLGDNLIVVRGDLIRENLAIQINPRQTREERLAWLAQSLYFDERLKNGQGIIYCLTQRDCETVADFLKNNRISAEAYHSGLGKDDNDCDIAQRRMELFDIGQIRVLVSTIKLGMGYDKANIRFVIHYQLPQNLISYYQQIGRAGRDGKKAYVILLHGNEDEDILNFFIESAQAKPDLLNEIMESALYGVKLNEMMKNININRSKLLEAIKYLTVHGHIYKENSFYRKNIRSKFNSKVEKIKQEKLNMMRRDELENLQEYLTTTTCYMKFVADELDAPDIKTNCGICSNCVGHYLIPIKITGENLSLAASFLKNIHGEITPRKQWGTGGKISEELQFRTGWILSDDYYSEIGQQVQEGKYVSNYFSDELVSLSADYIRDLTEKNGIDLVVPVPSLRRPKLVPDFTYRLSNVLNLCFENAVKKTIAGAEQKTLLNSTQQEENIRNSTSIDKDKVLEKTILLVDDMVDSKWSFTVIAAELLTAGAKDVYPFALVKTGNGD